LEHESWRNINAAQIIAKTIISVLEKPVEMFKGVVVSRGEAQLACAAYIDLNPVRAGVVEKPEDYRWCSMGFRVRAPKSARVLLDSLDETKARGALGEEFYRLFVYDSGGIPILDKAQIPQSTVAEVNLAQGRLGIKDRFKYRMANFSEGIALGTREFIANIQEALLRKFIRTRAVLTDCELFATRVLG